MLGGFVRDAASVADGLAGDAEGGLTEEGRHGRVLWVGD